MPSDPGCILHFAYGGGGGTEDESCSRLAERQLLRFDGLFEAFFEAYWVKYCGLDNVRLRCVGKGIIVLRILRRRAPDGAEEEVLSLKHDLDLDELAQIISLRCHEHGETYLVLEVELTAGALLQSVAWESTVPPTRQVRIGAVITTFNREFHLRRILHNLQGHLAGGCILVVNHGEQDLADRMADIRGHGTDIQFVDQANSGGAGGFIRGMREFRSAGNVTHIVLMDDDIDVPICLLERLKAVLSYQISDFCIGGAMFDYEYRDHLFTAGDQLVASGFGITHINASNGCDVSTSDGVDFLARVHHPDFNGWWCFACSLDAIAKAGYPMPCFIRGDDVEFGYRLQQLGWPTIPWPGVAVWHKSFKQKAAPWHAFYDRRNSLWANRLHQRLDKWAVLRAIMGGFLFHLLRFDYERANAMCRGVEAFNDGIAALVAWNDKDHAALIAQTSQQVAPPCALEANPLPLESRRLTGYARKYAYASRFLADLLLPWRRTDVYVVRPGEDWRPDLASRPSRVIEYNGQHQPIVFEYCSKKTRALFWKFLSVCAKMLASPARLSEYERNILTGINSDSRL